MVSGAVTARSAAAASNLHGTYGTVTCPRRPLEQVEQEWQLMGRIPGQVVVLGVPDGQLGILVAQVGRVDHLDCRPYRRFGGGVVHISSGNSVQSDPAGDPHHGIVEVRPQAGISVGDDHRTSQLLAPGRTVTGLGGQQAQRCERGLSEGYLSEFIVVTLRVGLPQRRCDREGRTAQGCTEPSATRRCNIDTVAGIYTASGQINRALFAIPHQGADEIIDVMCQFARWTDVVADLGSLRYLDDLRLDFLIGDAGQQMGDHVQPRAS